MKNYTKPQFSHPRYWTREQETLVMSIVNNRRKHKTLHQAFAKAARAINRSVEAVAIHYYANIRPVYNVVSTPVKVQKKVSEISVRNNQFKDSNQASELVSFVRTLFTRLTPAERAEVLKNLV